MMFYDEVENNTFKITTTLLISLALSFGMVYWNKNISHLVFSSLIGSIIVPIYFGVVLGTFPSFEHWISHPGVQTIETKH
jgi:ABC-type proline/glycine betaine transport system permease subunit